MLLLLLWLKETVGFCEEEDDVELIPELARKWGTPRFKCELFNEKSDPGVNPERELLLL